MSNATISNFITAFNQGGGARANRYQIQFVQAPIQFSGLLKDKFVVACKAASIPQSEVGITEVHYMGRTIKLPGDRVFNDWTITVLNDTAFDLRGYFDQWSNYILGMNTNTEGYETFTSGFGTAEVLQYDRNDNITATYTVEKIWPTTVGEISLSYDQDNTIEEFQVTFAINEWSSTTIKTA